MNYVIMSKRNSRLLKYFSRFYGKSNFSMFELIEPIEFSRCSVKYVEYFFIQTSR